jgi:hypothetical protein
MASPSGNDFLPPLFFFACGVGLLIGVLSFSI